MIGVAAMALCTVPASAVSPKPYILEEVAGLPITNSMVMSWIISLLLIVLVRVLIKRPQILPHTGQAVVENLIEGLREIFLPVVGPRMIGVVFPMLLTLFTFILMHNWSGLLPGVGTIGTYDEAGHLKYFFRPGNADLNMTIALAIIAAVFGWLYFVLRYAGVKTLVFDLFGNKADPAGIPKVIYLFLFPVFFLVGMIEVVSILFRPVSLSFRLFGNVFGGENLLVSITDLTRYIVPVPFYFLEMLIGLVQALVFSLLTAVYIGLITNHGDDEGHAH